MTHIRHTAIILALTTATVLAADWQRFRGPSGSGHADDASIPVEWSSAKNLKWRTALPGMGASSPVVSGDRVYLTAYTGYGLDMANPGDPKKLVRHLLAFDRESGKELWRASVPSTADEDRYQGFITQHGYASSTPVTDGQHVYAILGKSGMYAYDKDGKKLWHAELGQKSDPARWGDGSSPIIVGDVIVVDAGVLGNHFVGIDKKTGKQRWSVKDPSYTNSWSTPTDVHVDGKPQVLVHVPFKVMGLDPANGDIIWSATSPLDDASCGSIVTKNNVAFLMGSRAGHGMAVRYDGKGDVTESHAVWNKRMRSGICTPVIVGDRMYWSTGGIFQAARLSDGENVYKERLPRLGGPTGGFPNADYSSPVAVGNRIIQFTRNGESYVIEAADTFKLVAHNPAFDGDKGAFSSSPAVSDGELFIRSDNYLYCIAAENRSGES